MREDWVEASLYDVFEILTGNTPPKKDRLNYNGNIPFVKPPNLWNKVVVDTEEYLTEKGALKSRILPPFSVLITCIGNLGRVGINKTLVAFNQQINAVLPNKNIDSIFTFYQFQSPDFKQELEKKASATTVSIINKGNFSSLSYKIAPIPEQKAIVNKIEKLFTALDKGKEDLKKAQQQLKIYRQAVLKKAFEGGFLTFQENNRPVLIKLGSVIDKPKYGTSKKCIEKPHGKAVLRIPNLKNEVIDINELKYAEFDEAEIEKLALKEGDLLTIRSNGSVDLVGKCALISKNDTNYLYAGYLIRIRPDASKILSKYLLYCMKSQDLRVQIESKAKSTSGVNNINSGELESLYIPYFNIEEQTQIVKEIETRFSVCDQLEEDIKSSLEKSEALRQSILKKAFEGKLLSQQELNECKQSPDYEPAFVLLRRIEQSRNERIKR